MIASVRTRIPDLIEILSQLDAQLETGDAGRLPGLALARTAIAVDRAATGLARLASVLAASGSKSPDQPVVRAQSTRRQQS